MEKGKVRVIIKRPDEKYGHVTNISPTLENLQRNVGGYIETVTLAKMEKEDGIHKAVIICNEEGKLQRLPKNILIGYSPFAVDAIAGDLIVGQYGPEGEMEDLDIISFREWKKLVDEWGN